MDVCMRVCVCVRMSSVQYDASVLMRCDKEAASNIDKTQSHTLVLKHAFAVSETRSVSLAVRLCVARYACACLFVEVLNVFLPKI